MLTHHGDNQGIVTEQAGLLADDRSGGDQGRGRGQDLEARSFKLALLAYWSHM